MAIKLNLNEQEYKGVKIYLINRKYTKLIENILTITLYVIC